jgi:hypothetical protein
MLSTVRRFIYTKYWELLLVEHCGNIYLYKLLGNTLCWTLGKFIYTKYWNIKYSSVFCVNKSSHSAQHTVYSSVFCVNKSSHSVQHTVFCLNKSSHSAQTYIFPLYFTKYWGLLLVEHCGNIYLHKILGNTLCWTLGKFIYTK